MAKLTIILDSRRANKDGLYPIKLQLTNNRTNTTISTGYASTETAFIGKVDLVVSRSCPLAEQININVQKQYIDALSLLNELERKGAINNAPAATIKDHLEKMAESAHIELSTFTSEIEKYADNCRAQKTAVGYRYAKDLLHQFMNKRNIYFEDITFATLTNFDRWMEKRGMGINSRSIIFRNIRTVFNHAIKLDIIQPNLYPFRKFEIKRAKVDKDFLTTEEFQDLLALDLKGNQELARDYFLLSFYLCGINPIDLFNLKKPDLKGKVTFIRQKIAPKEPPQVQLYIPQQAQAIIDKYKGQRHLLYFAEKHDYGTFIRRVDRDLKVIEKKLGRHLYMYLARDTWATHADMIGVPLELISKALGHTDSSTAEKYYISFDWTRVKRANEQVIEHITSSTLQPLANTHNQSSDHLAIYSA